MEKSDKIRILHISQVQGGIQTYIEQIIKNIDQEKFELFVACPTMRQSLITMVTSHHIPYLNLEIKIEISPIHDIKSIIDTIKLIRKVKPGIIHAHSSKAGMIARIASLFCKPKVAYTPNAYAYLGKQGYKRKFMLLIEKMAIPFTDFLLAASKSEAKRSLNDLHFPEKKVVIFQNSIEILPYENVKNIKNKKMITMVARLVDQKNPLMFLRVCKIISDLRDDVVFQIIGSGFDDQLKHPMENYIKENQLEEKFLILPWMDRTALLETVRDSDVFVMTSAFESFGYVIAEAQLFEVPVVATDVDGLNEIIENNTTGYLVALDDDKAMAEKILFIINNPSATKEMTLKGRLRVRELYDIKKNIKTLEKFYEANCI